MLNTPVARINLRAVRDNLSVVRSLCPHSRTVAMIKADAYGHGLLQVAGALSAADAFAVARLNEALMLRQSGISHRILLLGNLLDHSVLAKCSAERIDVTAHDELSVTSILSQAKRTPLRVWLKLDSGMHRMGLSPEAFVKADRALSAKPGILELIHMTHFSCAGDEESSMTAKQAECFWACRSKTSQAAASLANSAALISRPETHADWVRPGIMLYGENPLGAGHHLQLQSSMTLSAPIIAIREISAGESVGYSNRWISTRTSRIGTVGIGYGDGYPRHARIGTPVLVNGCRVPVVGQISMDSLTLDLTNCGPVTVGDEAILWGPQLPASLVAASAETISYQLFTSLTQRVAREYCG